MLSTKVLSAAFSFTPFSPLMMSCVKWSLTSAFTDNTLTFFLTESDCSTNAVLSFTCIDTVSFSCAIADKPTRASIAIKIFTFIYYF